ncbi:hypothetical protein HaLaN_32011, partial [Haematococcus lacustris]
HGQTTTPDSGCRLLPGVYHKYGSHTRTLRGQAAGNHALTFRCYNNCTGRAQTSSVSHPDWTWRLFSVTFDHQTTPRQVDGIADQSNLSLSSEEPEGWDMHKCFKKANCPERPGKSAEKKRQKRPWATAAAPSAPCLVLCPAHQPKAAAAAAAAPSLALCPAHQPKAAAAAAAVAPCLVLCLADQPRAAAAGNSSSPLPCLCPAHQRKAAMSATPHLAHRPAQWPYDYPRCVIFGEGITAEEGNGGASSISGQSTRPQQPPAYDSLVPAISNNFEPSENNVAWYKSFHKAVLSFRSVPCHTPSFVSSEWS